MRLRLFLSFALIVVVSVAAVVILARQSAASEVRRFMFRGGMTGTGGLVSLLEDYYQTNGSWQGVEGLLSTSGHSRGMGGMMMSQRIRLADAQGRLVADTDASLPFGQLSDAEMRSAIALKVDGRAVGYLLAEGGMGYSRADEIFLLNRLTQAALTAGLIAVSLSLLLALFLAYRLLRPVRELTRAARRLGEGDLSQRVHVHGNDELAVLGRTFNSMADSLQQAGEARRAMTADIAHELRNPLAVQRASLEALQDGVYPLTPENLDPVLEQNLLLTRLVDDLRTLALADSGQLKLERVPTDLPDLLRRVVERFLPQAATRGVDLRLDPSADAGHFPLVSVDPQRVEQIINNLLSNALRYTPDGGAIQIGIELQSRAMLVNIHDSGPGIPAEALPHVFERFYRVDRSRSRSEGGSGLGLAIARHLAEAHGGALIASNHPRGGALFTLSLPLD
jgi:two-component system OmpR family sensor kinase/two-component system sensor histidine kinase BaeS